MRDHKEEGLWGQMHGAPLWRVRVAEALASQAVRIRELEQENTTLRASTANSGGPCLYCKLPKEDWSKCAQGFPGCARGDDAMLCPHVGADLGSMDRIRELEQRLVQLEDEKNAYIDYVGDALGQDHDGESLWDAAQRVLSDRDRMREQIAAHEKECAGVQKDADRYIWLLAHMGLVASYAALWDPRFDKPLLRHLQDYIDIKISEDRGWIIEQRELLNDDAK